MDLQGVHDILHCTEVSHIEVVNNFNLATEDFQQDARDSVSSLDASPEEDNSAMPNLQSDITLFFHVHHADHLRIKDPRWYNHRDLGRGCRDYGRRLPMVSLMSRSPGIVPPHTSTAS